jgi:hypothetical protein
MPLAFAQQVSAMVLKVFDELVSLHGLVFPAYQAASNRGCDMALAAQLKTGQAHVGAFQRPDAPIRPLAFGLKLGVGRLQPCDVGLQAAQQIQVGILPQQLLFSI